MLYNELPKIFGDDPLNREKEGILTLKNQYGISAPQQIFEQIYCGLCTNEAFQRLYGHIQIDLLRWDLISLPTVAFIELERNATFPDFMLDISEDFNSYNSDFRIDGREEVSEHWVKYGTWNEPPMFIDRSLLSPSERGLHLMEGHKRVGTLIGAEKYGFIKIADMHQVYLAKHI
ncbi:TPA: hypothetical protein R8G79_000926 [Citrobacter amalonaticus]|nr:hypothetical protein [Citrobacter amalonaticus]HEM8560977.1 hypothetical protein [Citrobacter farmeri]